MSTPMLCWGAVHTIGRFNREKWHLNRMVDSSHFLSRYNSTFKVIQSQVVLIPTLIWRVNMVLAYGKFIKENQLRGCPSYVEFPSLWICMVIMNIIWCRTSLVLLLDWFLSCCFILVFTDCIFIYHIFKISWNWKKWDNSLSSNRTKQIYYRHIVICSTLYGLTNGGITCIIGYFVSAGLPNPLTPMKLVLK